MKRETGTPENAENNQNEQIETTLAEIKEKLLVMSGKGGVGKSTVAVNLAVCLADEGFSVGLMDIDLHGPNTLKMLGLEGAPIRTDGKKLVPLYYNENLKVVSISSMLESPDSPVIWRGPLKIGAIKQFIADVAWGSLDYLVIDSPPGTGDEPLTIAQVISGSKAVIITTPQAVSIMDVRKSINFCKKVSMPVLGLIENMSGLKCPHCGENIDLFGSGGGVTASKDMGVRFLGAIPLDPEITVSGDSGNPYILSHSNTEIAGSFRHIVSSLTENQVFQGGEK